MDTTTWEDAHIVRCSCGLWMHVTDKELQRRRGLLEHERECRHLRRAKGATA